MCFLYTDCIKTSNHVYNAFIQLYVETVVDHNQKGYWIGLKQDDDASDITEGWNWIDGSTPGPDTDGIR